MGCCACRETMLLAVSGQALRASAGHLGLYNLHLGCLNFCEIGVASFPVTLQGATPQWRCADVITALLCCCRPLLPMWVSIEPLQVAAGLFVSVLGCHRLLPQNLGKYIAVASCCSPMWFGIELLQVVAGLFGSVLSCCRLLLRTLGKY